MPLLDHFRPPLATDRHWESFHGTWATEIMAALNQGVLPAGYFAETQVHIGSRVEVDVASFAEAETAHAAENNGGVATQPRTTRLTSRICPAVFPDEIEVQVFRTAGGATLVAVIELVSRGNKDREEKRRAFAAKCFTHLQRGVGLLIVDVVTELAANLHNGIMAQLGQETPHLLEEATLYAVSYRPFRTSQEEDRIEYWPVTLAVGAELPTMPLPLQGGPAVQLDLDETYMEARRRCLL